MTRGPVPKRTSELTGHSRKEKIEATTRVRVPTPVTRPREKATWHPIAKMVYKSTRDSGQAKWYEPSDWAHMYLLCDEISFYLTSFTHPDGYEKQPQRTAMRLQVINQMMNQALMTEGERRRVNMEIDRGVEEDPAVQAASDFYEQMLEG